MQGERQHYRIFNADDPAQTPVQGRVIEKGLVNELYDREYVVVKGEDGYAYYVGLDNTGIGVEIGKGSIIKVQLRLDTLI